MKKLLFVVAGAGALMGSIGLVGAATSGDAVAGRAVAERWCASCHAIAPGQRSAVDAAPPFSEIAKRRTDLSFLEGMLADPHPPMPQMSLSRQEIRDLIAYLATTR